MFTYLLVLVFMLLYFMLAYILGKMILNGSDAAGALFMLALLSILRGLHLMVGNALGGTFNSEISQFTVIISAMLLMFISTGKRLFVSIFLKRDKYEELKEDLMVLVFTNTFIYIGLSLINVRYNIF